MCNNNNNNAKKYIIETDEAQKTLYKKRYVNDFYSGM